MAYEVYSFQHFTRQLNLNCIAPLLQDGLDMHVKDMQMLNNKVEELKVFSSSINKTMVKYGCDEVIQCGPKLPSLLTYPTEDETNGLIDF